MQGTIHEVAWQRSLELDLSLSGQNGWLWRRPEPPPAIPAAESALGLRPRIALSSAQVLPEWITSTSPRKDFSSNGDYPLNFLSHWKGSPQCRDGRWGEEDGGKQAGSERKAGRRILSGTVSPKEVCKSVDKERYARNGSKRSAARYSVNLLTLLATRRIVRLA